MTAVAGWGQRMKRMGLIVALIAASGCGKDEKPKFYQPPGGAKDSGTQEETDASVDDAGKSDGPVLKFTTPDPAMNPNDATVLTDRTVTVHCEAKPRPSASGAQVNGDSVAITLVNPADETKRIAPPTNKIADDEYEAKFDVSELPNGELRFHCAAKDLASSPKSSDVTLDTLLDLGPKLEIMDPKDKGSYALHTPIVIQFKVSPQPLADGDEEAAVKDVKLTVSGMEQTIAETEGMSGLFKTSIDFADPNLFKVPPTSAEILVTASNGRTPQAAIRSLKYDVTIDGAGPSIRVESPGNGTIVHGEVTLNITVEDMSGIEPGSLRAVINSNLRTISDWEIMGSSYRQTFDTRAFGLELTQLTINFTATDVVGNEATVSHLLRLDNVPPLLDLDPPLVREFREDLIKTDDKYYCSMLFDPVGDLAMDDLSTTATTASYFRVLVEDRTNTPTGSLFGYYAGIATTKVVLYAQPDPATPLLIDTTGDGICDEVNFTDLPEAKRPVLVRLSGVDSRGGSYFAKMLNDYSGDQCSGDPNGADPPEEICEGTEMYRVVRGRREDKPPAVYAFNPTNASTGECEGAAWEVMPIVGQGWRCLAARAEDTIGNVGISAPLRVCFDSTGTSPACDPSKAPKCTKDCTLAASQSYGDSALLWDDLN